MLLTPKSALDAGHYTFRAFSPSLLSMAVKGPYVVRFWFHLMGPKNGSLSVYGVDEEGNNLSPRFTSLNGPKKCKEHDITNF